MAIDFTIMGADFYNILNEVIMLVPASSAKNDETGRVLDYPHKSYL